MDTPCKNVTKDFISQFRTFCIFSYVSEKKTYFLVTARGFAPPPTFVYGLVRYL